MGRRINAEGGRRRRIELLVNEDEAELISYWLLSKAKIVLILNRNYIIRIIFSIRYLPNASHKNKVLNKKGQNQYRLPTGPIYIFLIVWMNKNRYYALICERKRLLWSPIWMNSYLAYANTESVQSRLGSEVVFVLFVVLFFTISLLFLLDTILYIRSEQSVCSRIIDDDGQWRENKRKRPYLI